jgi:hypothetical protein
MNLKKLERYLRVNLLGPGSSSYKKIIYRAAVSQRLGNTAVDDVIVILLHHAASLGNQSVPDIYKVAATTTLFGNAGNQSANDVASYPTRPNTVKLLLSGRWLSGSA